MSGDSSGSFILRMTHHFLEPARLPSTCILPRSPLSRQVLREHLGHLVLWYIWGAPSPMSAWGEHTPNFVFLLSAAGTHPATQQAALQGQQTLTNFTLGSQPSSCFGERSASERLLNMQTFPATPGKDDRAANQCDTNHCLFSPTTEGGTMPWWGQ